MLTRRQFLSATGAGAASLLAKDNRPNVLFLSVDDMNDWVGCLGGYPGVQTPNIDALAKRGILFANAQCPSPLCNPSRTALFTGLRPSTSGIYNNEQYFRPNLPDAVTIPQYFRKNGYTAVGAGKVLHHVAGFNPPDQWDDFQLQVFDDPWYRRPEWYPWNKKEPNPPGHPFNGIKNIQGEFDWGVLPKPESAYGDQRAIEYGRKFLQQPHDKPFFLAVGLWHPHIPMFSPQRYFDLYKKVRIPDGPPDDLEDVPAVGKELAAVRREELDLILKDNKWEDFVRAYLAAISFADAMVGDMLQALEQSQYARNTIVVFWSDNGWHLGEKQHVHKSTLWMRSTHVPLIVAGPGMQGIGETRRQPVNLLDLYPTLVELCGLPPRKELEGTSLAPLLKNPKAPRQPTLSTYLPGNHMVRDERFQYIRYHDGTEELYDCDADPNEWHNIAGDAQYTGVKRYLAQYMPKVSAPSKPERSEFNFDFRTYTYSKKP